MELLESTQTQSDFPERDYCMVTLFLNCGMRLAELVGMNLDDIDLENRQIRLFGKGHKERMVYLNDACMEALRLYLGKRNTMEGFAAGKGGLYYPTAQRAYLEPQGRTASDRCNESSRIKRLFHT